MKTLFLDLETIPDQRNGALEEIRATIQPPGNMSKPDTILKWMAENADEAAEEKWRKTALDGSRGEILCIGYEVGGDTRSLIRKLGESEADLIGSFYADIIALGVDHLSTIVGHNVTAFDLRFLFQRSVINNIRPPIPLRTESRYTDFVYDTMTAWAGWGNRISLANLCAALGVPVKENGLDGSKVWDAVLSGEYERIAEYCRQDVMATREVYNRMTFQGGDHE